FSTEVLRPLDGLTRGAVRAEVFCAHHFWNPLFQHSGVATETIRSEHHGSCANFVWLYARATDPYPDDTAILNKQTVNWVTGHNVDVEPFGRCDKVLDQVLALALRWCVQASHAVADVLVISDQLQVDFVFVDEPLNKRSRFLRE